MTEVEQPRRAKGTGTVRNKGTEAKPNWYACWWVTDNGTGKRAQRSKGGFATKAKAELHLRKIMVAKDEGLHVDVDRKMTVAGMLDAWLVAKRVEGSRQTTLDSYAHTFKWVTPRIGAVKLAALTTEHVDAMLADLLATGARGGKPLSSRSVQLAGTVLRMALRWAVRRGLVARNVATDAAVPGAKSVTMNCWSAAEVRRYIDVALRDREGALYVLAVLRPMRRGELVGLRREHLDLDAKSLRVLETLVLSDFTPMTSQPKTRAGRRAIPLDEYLTGVLRKHLANQAAERLAAGSAWADTDYVFTDELGRPLHPDHVSNRHEALCRAAGLPPIRMHDLRHTCITLMLINGTPVHVVAEMAGHADPSVTLRVYAHVLPGHSAAAGESLTASVMGL